MNGFFILVRFPFFIVKILFTIIFELLVLLLGIFIVAPLYILVSPLVFINAAFKGDSSYVTHHFNTISPVNWFNGAKRNLSRDVLWLKYGGEQ